MFLFLSSLRKRFGRRPSARTGGRPAPRYRLRREALEDRLVPSSTPGLHVVPSPAINQSILNATAAVAPNDVWAVGEFMNPNTGGFQPLAEHFNGTSWSVVPTGGLPAGNFGELMGVAAVSNTNVWAVGMSGNVGRSPLTEHWDGTSWSIIPSPNKAGALNGVTALGTGDIVAVGSGNLILHS